MASTSVPCPKISSSLAPRSSSARLPAPTPKFASFGPQLASGQHNGIRRLQAKLNHAVTAETNSNCATIAASPEEKVGSAEKIIPDAAEISAFMGKVSDLIKLVDSRDIVELELKQLGCEVRIRKKEALQQVAPATPVVTMPQFMPAPPASAAPAPPAHSPVSPAAPAAPATAKTGGTSHPPLKCPMAGTFYRCPGPGEPPFVKVGDKVQKGQVVCIIEAMKLMNEIEADRSGTITEILVEDGKPVSVDLPLFVIAP